MEVVMGKNRVKFFLCTTMSPGSRPTQGILPAKIKINPAKIKIMPKKIKLLPSQLISIIL